MRKNTIAAAALSLTLLSSGILATAAHPHHALAEPSASQETLNKLSDAEARYEKAQQQLAEAGQKVEAAGENLAETEENIEKTETEIQETLARIEQKKLELAKAQEVLSNRVAANYRAGNLNLLDVLLDATD